MRQTLNFFTFSVIVVFLGLSGCHRKSVETVMPELQQPQSRSCEEARVQGKFLVIWESGEITTHFASSAESFAKAFVEPQLSKIRHAESAIWIRPHWVAPPADAKLETWGQDLTEVQAVWDQGIFGEGVAVGVTDMGIDYTHPQLAPNLAINQSELAGQSGVDDDGNGLVDDIHGWDFVKMQPQPVLDHSADDAHGTHVAGIIAAAHEKGEVKGIAPKSKLIPAAFLSKEGGDVEGAIAALLYTAKRGARIINASWGGASKCSKALEETFASLSRAGILLAVAAGNEGLDLDVKDQYPAILNMPTQITVAWIRPDLFMSVYSNFGFDVVNIAAPGDQIFSTAPHNRTMFMDGTSMATPFVSGAAALLWSARPQATARQIRQAILSSADTGRYAVTTKGRLNIRRALAELKTLVP